MSKNHLVYPRFKHHHKTGHAVLVKDKAHEDSLEGYTERRDGVLEPHEKGFKHVDKEPDHAEEHEAVLDADELKEELHALGFSKKDLKGKDASELAQLLQDHKKES